MSSIFVVTVLTAPVPRPVARSDGSVVTAPFQRDARTWGWYADRDRARDALARNLSDLHETIYRDAVIEQVSEGVPADVLSEEWFRFSPASGGYVPDGRPVDLEGKKGFFAG